MSTLLQPNVMGALSAPAPCGACADGAQGTQPADPAKYRDYGGWPLPVGLPAPDCPGGACGRGG